MTTPEAGKGKWPTHLGPKRAFFSRKRREYRSVMRTIDDLRFGCAFLPGYKHIALATYHLKMLGKERRNWR